MKSTCIVKTCHKKEVLENMFLRTMIVMAVIFLGKLPLQAQESFYPPLLSGKPDFEGLRFIVRDENGHVKGDRPYMLKTGFILKVEAPPVDLPVLGSERYYLSKDKIEDEEDRMKGLEDEEKDTFVEGRF